MARSKHKKWKGRTTGAQSIVRQNTVYKRLLDGYPRREIIQFCAKKWGIGPDQVDNYIKKATDEWSRAARMDRESELAKEIERANKLLQAVLKRKSYQTALSAMKHLCALKKLNGLEIDIKGAISLEHRLEGMTDEEIQAGITENLADLKQVKAILGGTETAKPAKGSGE